MLNDGILKEIFNKRLEEVEKNIYEEYHKRLKVIKVETDEERNNIKMNLISELYYKQGFKDGINFLIESLKNN